MKFTIPLNENLKSGSRPIESGQLVPYLPKEKEKNRMDGSLTLLAVTVRSVEKISLPAVAGQCLKIVLSEFPNIFLSGIMFRHMKKEGESVVFELTSFGAVGEHGV